MKALTDKRTRMITISNNDLKQLLLYLQATGKMREVHATSDLRLCNRLRLAKNTAAKLLKREDVQRVMKIQQETLL